MKSDFIYLARPHMGGNEINFVKEAIETNWVAPIGENIDSFEKKLESYLGPNNFAAALSSGTAAIHLGLQLLDVQRGDIVLCQTMTFAASANPIVYLGAVPVFVDSELETWNMSPVFLEEAIASCIAKGKKPKAIITVHLYGMPYNVEAIHAVAKKYEIPILEDSAEALGSSYKGQKCGTFGDISVLSFNGNKIITTSGGGALVARNKDSKDRAIFLATQARDEAPHYEHTEIGYNYRLSNISAGIGCGQMEVLDKHVGLRREMNAFYQEIFNGVSGITVFKEPSEKYFSNHWLSCILVDTRKAGVSPSEIRQALSIANIECRPLWKPMHLQPVFKKHQYFGKDVSEKLFKTGLCLPSSSNHTAEEKERIAMALTPFTKTQ